MSERTARVSLGVYTACGIFFAFTFSYLYFERGYTDAVNVILVLSFYSLFYVGYRHIMRLVPFFENLSFSCMLSPLSVILLSSCLATAAIFILLATSYAIPGLPFHEIVFPVLKNIALIICSFGIATLLWHSSGKAFLRLLGFTFSDMLEEAVYSLALGSFGTMLFFYGAALVHALTPATLLFYALVVGVACRKELKELLIALRTKQLQFALSFPRPDYTTFKTVFVILVVSFLLLLFVSNGGYFPIGGDDIRTYYNVPKTYLENNGIVPFPYDALNNGSLAFSYIFLPLMLIDQRLTNFIAMYFFVLVLLSIFAVTKKLFDERTALTATFFFFCIPWTFWFLVTAKVDFMVTFYITTALAAILRYTYQDMRQRWLVIAGILVGCAVAIKYTALLFAPAIGAFLLGAVLVRRISFMQAARAGLTVVFFALLAFFPWAVRNYYIWGNAVYPFTLGGTMAWYAALSPSVQEFHRAFYSSAISVGHVLNKDHSWWVNLWYLIIGKSDYSANKIGPLFFGILPFFFLNRPKKEERGFLLSSILAILATAFAWFIVVTIQVWYMMFIFPLWCIFAAYIFSRISKPFARVLIVSMVLLAFFLELNTTRIFMVRFYSDIPTVRQYLQPFFFGIPLSDYLNDTLRAQHPEYISLPMGQQRQILVKDNYKHIYGNNTLLFSLVAWAADTTGPEELRDRMRSEGITHIQYMASDIIEWSNLWCSRAHDERACDQYRYVMTRFHELARTLTVVTSTPDWTIYEL